MGIYVNSALVLLALLPLKICAATDTVVLGPRATVLLENCSCGDGDECQSPQHDGFTVNCSTVQAGLTLKGCGDYTGGSPGKCSAVGGEENKILTGCNFSSEDALKNGCQCDTSPCTFRLSDVSNGGCGGRRIKLASLNGNCNFFCGFISGENRTNEPQQQFGQHGNSSNSSASSHKVESALKASPGGSPGASKTNGESSHSTSRGPESSEHDGTNEKLGASNTTTTPRKNDVQNEGVELCAMKVVVKCAAASLFISSAFF
ncbi:hypothetical protein ERJ75_001108800 [Trypanosoma vivax]|uniref:Uncharacterized protein n=1 Tax=Trypanosoma vivax (strain Y486) TaxID=1055687 RepID=F9WKV9_TRYVY|nr:hypothetical protein ERJ75_001108800 [Trypanosoma vivax]CCD18141.1 hypothetical protein, conserved in T. vivax [Trypanosoma vivax Y486]|eukprot:CCD18141.1 hypothetical protein, conserved in T. vivax [Trypanosoma vivax Y486]